MNAKRFDFIASEGSSSTTVQHAILQALLQDTKDLYN